MPKFVFLSINFEDKIQYGFTLIKKNHATYLKLFYLAGVFIHSLT